MNLIRFTAANQLFAEINLRTRRREPLRTSCGATAPKPGICSNTLALPIEETDNDILEIAIDEGLGTRYVEELLAFVQDPAPETQNWEIERDRLKAELKLILRRLLGPLTLWNESARPDFVKWSRILPSVLVASLMFARWNQLRRVAAAAGGTAARGVSGAGGRNKMASPTGSTQVDCGVEVGGFLVAA